MPQIAQIADVWSSQIFWVLITFGLVFFVIGKGMVPKILDTVGSRDQQIADDLAAAQSARDGADKQEEEWRERENENRAKAQGFVNEAKASAAASTEAKLAKVQTGLDANMAAAEARIAAASAAAAVEIEDVASEAAQDIVAQLAGVKVTKAVASTAVKKAMANG